MRAMRYAKFPIYPAAIPRPLTFAVVRQRVHNSMSCPDDPPRSG